MSTEDIKAWHAQRAHWVIDGAPYAELGCVFGHAVRRGFKGTRQLLHSRLKSGDCTWERLVRPVSAAQSRGGRRRYERSHDEIAAAIAALDARKREMGL